jgi:hypothetical protein
MASIQDLFTMLFLFIALLSPAKVNKKISAQSNSPGGFKAPVLNAHYLVK